MEQHQDLVSTVSTVQGTFAATATGATVTAWDSATFGPLLFVSARADFGPSVAVRGGIPICFPWFGVPRTDEIGRSLLGRDRALANHGFARQARWRRTADAQGHDGAWVVRYELNRNDLCAEPQEGGDAGAGEEALQQFEAELEAVFSDVLLDLAFTVRNTSDRPFTYEEALHAYLAVADAARTEVVGLDGVEYVDKVGPDRQLTQAGPITFGVETDRVYASGAPVDVIDHGGDRRIRVVKENSATTVVWNPGPDLAGQTGDLEAGEWRQFVCVEVANAYEAAVTLAPGEQHVMRARYEVSAL